MIGRENEICGGYSQSNTSNDSMKTHRLKHRHDWRKEKRYVVVTCSLYINENSPAKA